MRKFKLNDRNQLFLLPPNINDWLPQQHPARFIIETIESLDLSDFYKAYASKVGQPPYDPEMLLALLIYAYTTGLLSSRRIEQATWSDVAFRFIAANLHPDHDTIANFRNKHAAAITAVFSQVVQIAIRAKIVRLGHVSIDGTKIKANASREKRRTKDELERELEGIQKQFGDLLKAAEATDRKEDDEHGPDDNGYNLPSTLKSKEQRTKVIREAIEELKKQEEQDRETDPDGAKRRAWEAKAGKPYQQKVNTTDFDSRIMLFRNNVYDQGYNTQIVVDDDHGIIVASDVSQDSGDKQALMPMLLQVQSNTGWLPDNVSADAGYFNEAQMTDPRFKSVEFYVKPRKKAVTGKLPKKTNYSDFMRDRMEEPLGRSLYKLRMTLVEPAFGAIKQARGFRQFLLRGMTGVRCEWALICIGHNLKKMFKLNPSLIALLS